MSLSEWMEVRGVEELMKYKYCDEPFLSFHPKQIGNATSMQGTTGSESEGEYNRVNRGHYKKCTRPKRTKYGD